MDANERVIQALHEFENMTDADKVLTQELEDLFVQIAHTGRIQIPWIYFKPVFMFKMDKVMRDFFESSPSRNNTSSEPTHTAEFDVMRQRLLDCIESFTSAPFTVQRLCELMIEPKRHYKSSDKFMRGVEKNVLVVSTMTDIDGEELNNHESTSIHVPNGPVTNGIITTASTTEMEPVDQLESNGQQTEHYHNIHYPTVDELQHCNGNTTTEKSNICNDTNIEESLSIHEEKEQQQTTPDENKNPEDSPSEKPSVDNSDDNSEEKPAEEQTIKIAKQDPESEENSVCNTTEGEKIEDDGHNNKQEDNEALQQQATVKQKTEETQQQEVTADTNQDTNEQEPMEE